MTSLTQPLTLRGTRLRNRIMISPMCTYSGGPDGIATDWHLAHYGRLAMGGAGLVMLEATSIHPLGRHCYSDLGLWDNAQIAPLARITALIRSQGAVPAIQLQHAGRKGSARRPWHGGGALDATDLAARSEAPWQTIGPSPIPYAPDAPTPKEITATDRIMLLDHYRAATRRAVTAGFQMIEVHAAHGYLLNQFLSPIANQRRDAYGGSIENRMRFPLEVIDAVRSEMPEGHALSVRISAVDAVDGGWTLADSVTFCTALKEHGVDIIDVSSGGIGGAATMNRLARTPGFQVPFAEEIRRETGLPTIAVGLILTAAQAQAVVSADKADIIAIGRAALQNPNWPAMALTELTGSYDHWPAPTNWWLEKRADILRDYEASTRQHHD